MTLLPYTTKHNSCIHSANKEHTHRWNNISIDMSHVMSCLIRCHVFHLKVRVGNRLQRAIWLVAQSLRAQKPVCQFVWINAFQFGAGRSKVRFSAVSYQHVVNWYCRLPTWRTVRGRAAWTIQYARQAESNDTRPCTNSFVAQQDHCSYKAPSNTI